MNKILAPLITLLSDKVYEKQCINGVEITVSRTVELNGKRIKKLPEKFLGCSRLPNSFSWEKDEFGNTYITDAYKLEDEFYAMATIITSERDEHTCIITF
jgi:hypothetical protein